MSQNKFGTFATGDLDKSPSDADYVRDEAFKEPSVNPKKSRKTRPKAEGGSITAKEQRAARGK